MPHTSRRWLLGPLLVTVIVTGGFVAASATAAAASPATGTVAGPLNVRSGPSTSYPPIGQLANGAKVSLACGVEGEKISGRVRTTSQWDQTAGGGYVSHAYVYGNVALSPCPPVAVPRSGATGGPTRGMTNAEFIAASVAPAQQSQREFRVPASVTIAQAILESGWARSGLAASDRNFFGIKCFNGSPGGIANGCHSYATTECLPQCRPTTATFRTYASAADSYRDHGYFLVSNSRYRPAFAYTGNADQFLYQIWRAGYATSPTYVANVSALMRQYNLYRYDLR